MKTLILGAALAVAALTAAACSTTSTTTAATAVTTVVQNQATIRAGVERAFSTYADGIEAAVAGGLESDRATQASRLSTAHGVLLIGRAGFTASGVPTSAELVAAQKQADADFARVEAELSPS